jgi:hypothetical protein
MPSISPVIPRIAPDDRVYACVALGVYVGAFLIWPFGFGLMGFCMAFGALVRCITNPSMNSAGEWLFGLSWLANPVVWAGMILLGMGRRRWAAAAGFFALLLAEFAVSGGLVAPPYHLWIISMVVVVFASLRVRRSAKSIEGDLQIEPATRRSSRSTSLLCLALGAPLFLGVALIALRMRDAYSLTPALDALENADLNENVHTGEDAKGRILQRARGASSGIENQDGLPASAKDFWVYGDGGFGGSTHYSMFTCGSRDDCLKAVEYLGGIEPAELKSWRPSRFAVVMEGPGYYSRAASTEKKLRTNPWDVRGIKNGLLYEFIQGDHELMIYYAIDLDRNLVYWHEESGGFRADEYDPAALSNVGTRGAPTD